MTPLASLIAIGMGVSASIISADLIFSVSWITPSSVAVLAFCTSLTYAPSYLGVGALLTSTCRVKVSVLLCESYVYVCVSWVASLWKVVPCAGHLQNFSSSHPLDAGEGKLNVLVERKHLPARHARVIGCLALYTVHAELYLALEQELELLRYPVEGTLHSVLRHVVAQANGLLILDSKVKLHATKL